MTKYTVMRIRAALADLVCQGVLLAALASPSVWARLYFENNTPGFLTAALALILAMLALTPWLAGMLWQRLHAPRLVRTLVLMLAAIWFASIASGGTLARSSPLVMFAVTLLAGSIGWRLQGGTDVPAWWPRCRLALCVAALLFSSASPVLGHMFSADVRLLPATGADQRLPTLWLLLDETSAGAGEQLTQAIRSQGLYVSWSAVQSGGENTLDVIPSLVARRSFGTDAAPCGPTVLCSKREALDFSRVDVGRSGVDIVGVYHPYCAMRGWRSCAKEHTIRQSWTQQLADLRCAGARWLGTEATCLRSLAAHDLAVRAHAIQAMQDAPFWQQGGDLLVHILLPHMPATEHPQPSLGAAYEANLATAVSLLHEFAHRLQTTFPDFRLVVFSDHPLRAIDRCNAAYSGDCERPEKYIEPFLVPLIVASPAPLRLQFPQSNLTVFDLPLAGTTR